MVANGQHELDNNDVQRSRRLDFSLSKKKVLTQDCNEEVGGVIIVSTRVYPKRAREAEIESLGRTARPGSWAGKELCNPSGK